MASEFQTRANQTTFDVGACNTLRREVTTSWSVCLSALCMLHTYINIQLYEGSVIQNQKEYGSATV
jgi:hypothetical protein